MAPSTGQPFLIVGLGNPGEEYEQTRHNVGFHVVDELAKRWRADSETRKFKSLLRECSFGDFAKVLLLKPMTYMNLSGEAVGEVVRFYKIEKSENLLVVSDDLDLPLGKLRLRLSGSSGGHNGLKSIIAHVGGPEFPRLRVGIGRSGHGSRDHVLGPFSKSERPVYDETMNRACDHVEDILKLGFKRAMDEINRRASLEEGKKP